MERTIGADRLYPMVAPLVEKMGCVIVELVSQLRRTGLQVHLVIYRAEGVGLQDCEDVYRAVLPRIEASDDRRDIHLEVSTPGLARNIKSSDEFALFVGRGVRVLMEDTREWVVGRIAATDETGLTIQTSEGELRYDYAIIRKARLQDVEEGQK